MGAMSYGSKAVLWVSVVLASIAITGCGGDEMLPDEAKAVEESAGSEAEQYLGEGRLILDHARQVYGPGVASGERERFSAGLDGLQYGDIVECGSGRWRLALGFDVPEADPQKRLRQGHELVGLTGYELSGNITDPSSAEQRKSFFVGGRAADGRQLSVDNSSGHSRVMWHSPCSDDPSMVELGKLKRNGPNFSIPGRDE